MPTYAVTLEGRTTKTMTVEADTPEEAAKILKARKVKEEVTLRPEAVESVDCAPADAECWEIVGWCEACGAPCLEGTDYAYGGEDGIHLCPKCKAES